MVLSWGKSTKTIMMKISFKDLLELTSQYAIYYFDPLVCILLNIESRLQIKSFILFINTNWNFCMNEFGSKIFITIDIYIYIYIIFLCLEYLVMIIAMT